MRRAGDGGRRTEGSHVIMNICSVDGHVDSFLDL